MFKLNDCVNKYPYNKNVYYEFNGTRVTIDSQYVTIKQNEQSLVSFSHEQVKILLEILNNEFNNATTPNIVYRDGNSFLNQPINIHGSGEYTPNYSHVIRTATTNYNDTEIKGKINVTNN